jgi:CCR4-NOT transcription complex subunit 1
LASFIVFNPSITLFNTQPSLKRIVHIAIDRSIRDAIQSPVLERSVSIAVVATREVVIKDFALEQNEEKMRKAAQYMVQSLAGNLASVSSRETLKVSMISNLRSLLVGNGFTEQTVPEQIIFIIVSDNLDLACSVMEKAAAEKSIPEIDDSLANSFMNRRKHREQRTGQPFYDPLAYASSHYLAMLPESLRMKPSGLTSLQMRVYEDFMRIPHGTAAPFNETARPLLPRQEIHAVTTNQGLESDNAAVSIVQVIEKAPGLVNDLNRLLLENTGSSLQSLSAQHPVKIAVQQLFWLISQSGNPDESCLIFSEKIVKALFLSDSSLTREVYVLVLRRLADFSKPLANELAEWFMYSVDPEKYNVAVTFAILNADIITCLELDLHLSRQLEAGWEGFLQFVLQLLKECCVSQNAVYSYIDFLHTFETLRKPKFVQMKEVDTFLSEVNSISALSRFDDVPKDGAHLKEHYVFLFKEWFTAFCHPASSEKFHLDFVSKLYLTGLFNDESFAPLFFRTSIELSVESFTSIKLSGATSGNPYQAIDAFSRLAVLLIMNNKDPQHGELLPEVNFAVKIFSVIVLVLIHSQEQNANDFDQKPLLRILSSILNDLKPFETEKPTVYQQILCSIRYP